VQRNTPISRFSGCTNACKKRPYIYTEDKIKLHGAGIGELCLKNCFLTY
jgi:hypothetical protein